MRAGCSGDASACRQYGYVSTKRFPIGENLSSFSLSVSVRAGESLMKLVADLKQYLILNDFHSVNEAITSNSSLFRATQIECDKKLMKLRDEMAMDLYDLEEEYYTSIFK